MKKIVLLFAVLGIFGLAHAQDGGGLRIGAHVGLPVGDASDILSFNFGADVSYLFDVAPGFQAGLASGYSHYLGKDIDFADLGTLEVPDLGVIPIAATGRYAVTPTFFVAGDIGYAVFVGKDTDGGGFYYQPKVGYSATKFDVYAGYKGISDNGTVGSINLGINFKF